MKTNRSVDWDGLDGVLEMPPVTGQYDRRAIVPGEANTTGAPPAGAEVAVGLHARSTQPGQAVAEPVEEPTLALPLEDLSEQTFIDMKRPFLARKYLVPAAAGLLLLGAGIWGIVALATSSPLKETSAADTAPLAGAPTTLEAIEPEAPLAAAEPTAANEDREVLPDAPRAPADKAVPATKKPVVDAAPLEEMDGEPMREVKRAPLAKADVGTATPANPNADAGLTRFPGKFAVDSIKPIDFKGTDITAVADSLKLCEGTIRIVGHSCSLGSPASHEFIGMRRARAVEWILRRAGIPARKMRVESAGSRLPIADNTQADGRMQNRRVTVSCAPSSP